MRKYFFFVKALLVFAFVFFVYSCGNNLGGKEEKEKKNERLIVIAMDFSKSTANTDIRGREIEYVHRLKRCFRPGDNIYIYQITNDSFKNPKKVFSLEIPFPGIFETNSQILKRYNNKYKKQLKRRYEEVMKLSYNGTDISSFILFIEREFGSKYDENVLFIISDGIESTEYVNPVKLVAKGPKNAIESLRTRNYMATMTNWKVIRTGLWKDITPKMMKLYDRFWEIYFREAKADYSRIGFEVSFKKRDDCEIF